MNVLKGCQNNKKYNVEIEQLVRMLEEVKKQKKNIIDILKPMKNSEYLSLEWRKQLTE